MPGFLDFPSSIDKEVAMNLLYITDSDIVPVRGGVKRSTHTLTRAFMQNYHIKCFLAYIRDFPTYEGSFFHDRFKITEHDKGVRLEDFIVNSKIDIIILQKILPKKYRILPVLEKIAERKLCKMFFFLHYSPDHQMSDLTRENIVQNIKYFRSLRGRAINVFKLATYPLYKAIKYQLMCRQFKDIHRLFDRVVLLSSRYIPLFARYARTRSWDKLVGISNPVTFGEAFLPNEIAEKKNEVLIVARFDEARKKLLRALKIWQQIEREKKISDWKLVIVGFGPQEELYKKAAAEMGLTNVSFEGGPKDPSAYYKRASIFMMTSASEGFANVLLEAQQMGVVPMAFDSFQALRDLIEDGYNGLIVPNADLDAYAERLAWLMNNRGQREEMAANAFENCKKFSIEDITARWIELFNSVLPEEIVAK
ncbi:MAG: glycosyltransferase [Candidatus Aminicenantes bacterium]